MSKTHHNPCRPLVVFVAVLQLAVLPAAHEFHPGCDHGAFTEIHDALAHCLSGHSCSCAHHSQNTATDPPAKSDEPHDHDSCPVCRAVFAATIIDFHTAPLPVAEFVSLLSERSVADPTPVPRFVRRSRGPPAVPSAYC